MPKARQALIVENLVDVASELRSLLEQMGFKVTVLDDPQQVADTLAGRDYEVALMNMTLPDMNWRKTIMTIKSTAKTTTVIAIKQSPDEDDVRLALNAGAYIVLYRPLTPAQLTSLLTPSNDGLFVALRD